MTPEQSAIPKQDPSTKLILIVDDDLDIIEYLSELLRQDGFRVKSASNGRIAMKRVAEEKVDLVMLDMMMPQEGGYETIRNLQSSENGKSAPVVVMTAMRFDRTKTDTIRQETNVVDVVTKPLSPYKLKALIHGTLNTKPPGDKQEKEIQQENREEQGPKPKWEMPPAYREKGKKDMP